MQEGFNLKEGKISCSTPGKGDCLKFINRTSLRCPSRTRLETRFQATEKEGNATLLVRRNSELFAVVHVCSELACKEDSLKKSAYTQVGHVTAVNPCQHFANPCFAYENDKLIETQELCAPCGPQLPGKENRCNDIWESPDDPVGSRKIKRGWLVDSTKFPQTTKVLELESAKEDMYYCVCKKTVSKNGDDESWRNKRCDVKLGKCETTCQNICRQVRAT
jgi:hypothetical protein